MIIDFLKKWWPYLAVGGVGAYGASKIMTSPKPAAKPGNGPTPQFTGVTKLTSYLQDAFFKALLDVEAHFQSKGAKVTGDDLLMMFLAESDCNPSIANSIGCAGLNQICNLKGVGFTQGVQAYIALPGDQQLVFVQRYFDNVNRYPAMVDVGSLYLANFSPAFLGRPDNFVMYREGVDKAYAANRGVDFGKKGFIEVADMAKFMRASAARQPAKFTELRARLGQARAVA